MNIVEVAYEDRKLYLDGAKIELPEQWCKIIEKRTRLYFGIRPEHIRVLRKERNKGQAMKATVKYVEDYGNKVGVYFQVKGHEFLAIMDSEVPLPGEVVYFEPQFDQIHLFDYDSSRNLGYPKGRKIE